ncbi:MAG TPA: ATP-binding protein [Rhodopila sp.]|uniref:sensor histidine kinase n=1 Tax=Rhodopila sp. TaxID=2480087 RepID=UPI002BC9AFD6|nr:ATP-binding protein [Rhodopila sp.]HVY17079.1 ATP-binding protein [Rhodopila sp.]
MALTIPLVGSDDILACRRHALSLTGAGVPDGRRFAAAVTDLACAALLLGGDLRAVFDRQAGRVWARIEGAPLNALLPDLEALHPAVTGRLRLDVDAEAVTLVLDGAASDAAPGEASSADPIGELRAMNGELLAAEETGLTHQEELLRLNAELEDTNRGVLALYGELDDRAEELRAAGELKTRFLSNVSHELRTPLNSILALCRLLLDHADGPLQEEQEKQVSYILVSATNLTELVNDLLDLAKAEAGRLEVRPRMFALPELFGSLRAVMRPLRQSDDVELIFEEPQAAPMLFTDDGKVSQIMRNLVSNALKFTEQGEVRVCGAFAGGDCRLTVADTGIGISEADRDRVFDEFTQIANPLQGKAKGTGLGLSLSRRLATLLGGSLTLVSAVGVGSTFTLALPLRFPRDEPSVTDEPGVVTDVLSGKGGDAPEWFGKTTDREEDAG